MLTHTQRLLFFFQSLQTSLSLLFFFFWCYLCRSRGRWPVQSQGLLGGSASGKQWSQSSAGECCTFELSLGRWQSSKAAKQRKHLCSSWVTVCYVNEYWMQRGITLMWGVLSRLTVAAINCFSNFSSCWGGSGDPQQNRKNRKEFDFSRLLPIYLTRIYLNL